jgi:hypothetical protein
MRSMVEGVVGQANRQERSPATAFGGPPSPTGKET